LNALGETVVIECFCCVVIQSTICDTGAQNLSHVVFGFLLHHILQLICFKILFTEYRYLFSNWRYAHL